MVCRQTIHHLHMHGTLTRTLRHSTTTRVAVSKQAEKKQNQKKKQETTTRGTKSRINGPTAAASISLRQHSRLVCNTPSKLPIPFTSIAAVYFYIS